MRDERREMARFLPDCFTYTPGWVPDHGSLLASLTRDLAWVQPTIQMYGRAIPVPRMTAWMGDVGYKYSGITNAPAPWHPAIAALRDRLADETGVVFNACLGNLYRDGSDSVAWHADDEPEFGDRPTIASVSLGEHRRFAIRGRTLPASASTWVVGLGAGDLLVMRDESQEAYQHAIPKTARAIGPRINLTFRRVV